MTTKQISDFLAEVNEMKDKVFKGKGQKNQPNA
jgi:hypothetical protein